MKNLSDTGVAAYLRLSRDEEKERGVSMEEKIRLRQAILQTIARHHNLELCPDQIAVELKSAGSLAERTELLALLDRCRHKELHTLICFDVDRLTRDVADLKIITQAFFKGEVTLITQRGVYRFDRHFDTTLLQILAVLGEKERRSFAYRRKAANEQRARSGHLSQGYAPYGYRWDGDAKVYRIEPGEYPIAEEIFIRFWSVGSMTIAADLNRRAVPPPGAGKRDNSAPHWLAGTVANILRNPFYCGHQVKRRDVDREGVASPLPRSQWIWSEERLSTLNEAGERVPLPHPVTQTEWEALQELTLSRKTGELRRSLLAGLLYCHAGSPMHQHCKHYACGCRDKGTPHRCWNVIRANIEAAVWKACTEFLTEALAVPLPRVRRSAKDNLGQLELERASTRRDLREKEGTMDELIRRTAWYHQLPGYGPERHCQALESLGREVEVLRRRMEELVARIERPDTRRAAPLLSEIARLGGIDVFLAQADEPDKHALLRLLVKRIDLDAPPKAMIRGLGVTFYPLDSRGETVYNIPIIHSATGTKRGPYLWRSRQQTETETETQNEGSRSVTD